MSTRAKNGIVQPRLHPTLLLTHIEPTTYKQAMKSDKWLQAMHAEYDALMKTTLVHLLIYLKTDMPLAVSGCSE
jgi:hypothetical protein